MKRTDGLILEACTAHTNQGMGTFWNRAASVKASEEIEGDWAVMERGRERGCTDREEEKGTLKSQMSDEIRQRAAIDL